MRPSNGKVAVKLLLHLCPWWHYTAKDIECASRCSPGVSGVIDWGEPFVLPGGIFRRMARQTENL